MKSAWFDANGIYKKIGYKGFFLYINLYRFRLHNQKQEHVFSTSIKMLKQCTGYSVVEVVDLIKKLKRYKIISLLNITNWSSQVDEHTHLIIAASDLPALEKKNIKGKIKDTPVTEQNHYINIHLPLMEFYKECGLNEKYYGLYCLLNRLSNGNVERKSYMSINKMAELLGYGDETLNFMIREMNKNYLLYSHKRDNGKNGDYFEHYLCKNYGDMEQFKVTYEKSIDQQVKNWSKNK